MQIDIPRITWAVLTMQDSDGKVSVVEIPVGNDIDVKYETNYGESPDLSIDIDETRAMSTGSMGQKLVVTIEASVRNPNVPLMLLRGHG
jgi:hypothetical protein